MVADEVGAVRSFNRFYTTVIGVLQEGLLRTPYTLTEARVIFELAQRDATEVADLRRELGLDPGYLSRVLGRFEAGGLVAREQSTVDGRRQVVRLTGAGRDAYATLDGRSASEVEALLARLTEVDRRRLVGAMGTIERVLAQPAQPRGYVLRPLLPGDLGWVVHRHGVRYAEEYGWDETFEAMVARIAGEYGRGHDPKRENAWIAEVEGEPVGSVFCVREDDDTARLRLLLVEPAARGMGIGGRLVDECLRFARRAGYREIVLWTYDVLADARRIYERAGFTVREQRPEHAYGRDLVGQTWARTL